MQTDMLPSMLITNSLLIKRDKVIWL